MPARRGYHPDWDTYIFNHGRFEVVSFLLANALYWLEELHFDGLRVDAVASMLYLDYSREDGQWLPNEYGGKENLEAIELLRRVNRVILLEPGPADLRHDLRVHRVLREWNSETSLDWYLSDDPARAGLHRFLAALGKLYLERDCLWTSDPDPEGFQWIACHDWERSIVAYERRRVDGGGEAGEHDHLVVVLNMTPVPREGYRLGAPRAGTYRLLLCSDAEEFGGSGYEALEEVETTDEPLDGYRQSMSLTLPPLAALVLEPMASEAQDPE